MRLSGLAFVLAALAAPGPLAAHEFWIEPQAFAVAPGAPLVADLLVGESLEGARYGYVPPNFTRFDVLLGGAAHPVEGRPGDRPALSMAVEGSGTGRGGACHPRLQADLQQLGQVRELPCGQGSFLGGGTP
ncbi:hypothetical protein [Ponticoccus litoralis]|uniref:DUF4198 domain-containing protein n=1 Tax=Ponticoccus litoralis TaxID=422297 RepID=A0AAW9SP98_9RHOB